MTLWREQPGRFSVWRGEPIGEGDDAISYPLNIDILPAEELEAIGLWRDDMIAPAEAIPEGKIAIGTGVERVSGVVTFVHDLADSPIPSEGEIVAERARRLALGFDYNFGDARGIHHIGTSEADMRKWLDEVTPISQALINAGMPSGEIGIFTDTGPVTVTASEWQAILLAAGQWRQPIYQASFALLTDDPIPYDFTDDAYWP
ncbi:DUF4376 domain-containing protein [Shinella sp.]|uniref:DUF4376 domain-containing protein n=1 Tax=Shinella sp. TaxID=1870904 RepID=UPI003F6F1D43